MSTCGGRITTQQVTVGPVPQQLVGALESRTRVTVRADGTNAGNIFLTSTRGAGFREGFPLAPNDAYQLEDRGARAEMFAVSSGGSGLLCYIITEGE